MRITASGLMARLSALSSFSVLLSTLATTFSGANLRRDLFFALRI